MQFFDDTGVNVLSGGKLNFYVAGTSTPLATYPTLADAQALTNANPNPIILDSAGRPDNGGAIGVYGVTTSDYKVVLTDANDVTIRTYDNIRLSTGGISNVVEDTTPQLGGQLDVNGNAIGDGTRELITFTEDGSAVNHIDIENQATGGGPTIRASGDDTNIDLNLSAKGTGAINLLGTSTASTEARLFEDTDNGSNYVGLRATSSIASSYTLTLPSAVASAANAVLESTSGGNLDWAQLGFTLVNRGGTNQSLTNATWTTVQFNTESFDVDSWYDSTTNYRYTPQVAGKYISLWVCEVTGMGDQDTLQTRCRLNGTATAFGTTLTTSTGSTTEANSVGLAIVDMNGSTDYLDLQVLQNSGGALNLTGTAQRTFQGFFRVSGVA